MREVLDKDLDKDLFAKKDTAAAQQDDNDLAAATAETIPATVDVHVPTATIGKHEVKDEKHGVDKPTGATDSAVGTLVEKDGPLIEKCRNAVDDETTEAKTKALEETKENDKGKQQAELESAEVPDKKPAEPESAEVPVASVASESMDNEKTNAVEEVKEKDNDNDEKQAEPESAEVPVTTSESMDTNKTKAVEEVKEKDNDEKQAEPESAEVPVTTSESMDTNKTKAVEEVKEKDNDEKQAEPESAEVPVTTSESMDTNKTKAVEEVKENDTTTDTTKDMENSLTQTENAEHSGAKNNTVDTKTDASKLIERNSESDSDDIKLSYTIELVRSRSVNTGGNTRSVALKFVSELLENQFISLLNQILKHPKLNDHKRHIMESSEISEQDWAFGDHESSDPAEDVIDFLVWVVDHDGINGNVSEDLNAVNANIFLPEPHLKEESDSDLPAEGEAWYHMRTFAKVRLFAKVGS